MGVITIRESSKRMTFFKHSDLPGVMEKGRQKNCERLNTNPLWYASHTFWRFQHDRLYCFKSTKNVSDHDQQVAPQDTDDSDEKKFLRCRECHAPITQPRDRIVMNEKHQHVFANPHGYIYHIGCFARALGCLAIGEETRFFSWFPGYTWKIALCGQCLTLLGWAFRSKESYFLGLILDKLK